MKSKGIENFDYSEDSIKKLDNIITEERNEYSQQGKSRITVVFGAYLGNAILKKYTGKWVRFGDGSVGVKLNDGQYIFPMTRISKRMTNGSEDSIDSLYKSIEVISKQIKQ